MRTQSAGCFSLSVVALNRIVSYIGINYKEWAREPGRVFLPLRFLTMSSEKIDTPSELIAAAYPLDGADFDGTEAVKRRMWQKLDLRLIPILFALFFVSFM
jgi:hypothetical protein